MLIRGRCGFWLGGGSQKPQQSRTRFALARSERPSERQVRLCPSKAERCTGDVGAPQGAVNT